MTDTLRRLARTVPLLNITTFVSVVVAIGGIVYAVHSGVANDGGRGGAVGCAITFFMFFTGRPTPESALTSSLEVPAKVDPDPLLLPEPADLDEARQQIEGLKVELSRLRGAVAAMLDRAGQEKVQLTVASVFSTLVWGFGDCIARAFGTY